MNLKKFLTLLCLLPAVGQINARTTINVGTSANASYKVNVFDSSSNTFYLGHKGLLNSSPATAANPTVTDDSIAVADVTNSSTSSIGSPLIATPVLGANRVRNLDIVWDDETKLLVASKEDLGGFGLGDRDSYGATGGVTAPTLDAVNELFFINPADGTSSIVLVDDFGSNSAIIDRVKAFGSTTSSSENNKVAVVVVENGDKNELLTSSNTSHGMRIYNGSGTAVGKLVRSATGTRVDFKATLSNITYDGTAFDVRSVYSMHWDSDLQRLYLGFLSTHGAGGANRAFVAMARPKITGDHASVTDDDLVLDSIIPATELTSLGTPAAGIDGIIAKKEAVGFSVNHLKTMKASTHTETNPRHYLVAQVRLTQDSGSAEGAEHLAKGIYAIPLVGGDTANADTGKVGQKAAPNTAVAAATELYNHRDLAALVGGTPVTALTDEYIRDVQVVGDTVFAVVVGDSTVNKDRHLSKVYASTAIFNADGIISAWSPWTTVLSSGVTNKVASEESSSIYSIGFDSSTGNFFYVAGNLDGAVVNQVGVTAWGAGDDTDYDHSMKNLTGLINSDFPQDEGGVWMARHFPAIKTAGLGNMDLTVLGSKGKVAIFSTSGLLSGKAYAADGTNVSAYTPYAVDLAAKANVVREQRPFAVASLTNAEFGSDDAGTAGAFKKYQRHYKSNFSMDGLVYPLCCEVGRVINKNPDSVTDYPEQHGYLFVGGAHELSTSGKTTGGVWVLRDEATDGRGWNAKAGDTAVNKDQMGSNLENYLGDGDSAQAEGNEPRIEEMNFKQLPIISDPVHDLVSTGQFLYAMTSEKLYRIRLHSKTSGTDFFNPTGSVYDQKPAMFGTTATSVDATSVADLTDKDGNASNNRYDKDIVVVQEVKSFAGGSEKFVNMVGIPNTQNIFVATVTDSGDSKIYLLSNADAAAVQGVRDRFTADGTYNFDISGKVIRRLNLVMSNTVNSGLTGLAGVIANLYVLTGSVANPNSSLYRLPITGTLTSAVAQTNFIDHGTAAFVATTWHGSGLIPVVENTEQLYNDVNFNGLPLFFAHSNYFNDAEFDSHLGHLSSDLSTNAKSINPISAATGTKQYTFGCLHLDLGANMLFGSFGAKIQE